jgi:hypothetical protein
MWEITFTITPERGYIDRGERALQAAGVRFRAVHNLEVLSDDSVVLVHEVEGDAATLRETLEESRGKVIEYAITNQADPLMAQLRVRPDETFQKLLDIHRSYGVSVNFPITYRSHDPVTIEMVEVGPKDELRQRIDATRDIATVRVEGLNRYEPSTRQLYQELTERQREVLETAVELGYYRNPREATHADIGEALSCSASVVGQHLRRIETTLVTSVVPTADEPRALAEAKSD